MEENEYLSIGKGIILKPNASKGCSTYVERPNLVGASDLLKSP